MRFNFNDITVKRVLEAINRRAMDIPDAFSWKFSTAARENIAKIEAYRDIHKGKRCFIIANGPSLKHTDMTLLRNEYTFSMNRAYLLYEEWGFVPSYFVSINELVLQQFANDIETLQMPKFVNFNCRDFFDSNTKNDLLMFLRLGLPLNDFFNGDVTKMLASGGTVTFTCLQLAYFMGFSEVILIGLDHSFVEKGVPNKTIMREAGQDESHCHPDYFPKGMKWQLPDLYRSECGYDVARQAYESDGRRIVDATIGGKCTVFEKISYDKLFAGDCR